MVATDLFTLNTAGTTLTVEVHGTVSSLASDEVLRNVDHILKQIRTGVVKDVVIDFHQVPYFGSYMLEMLRAIWNDIQTRPGRLILCNVSPVGQEILQIAKFDQLWPIVSTRDDAEHALAAAY